jgi:molecular chaperone DnaJ
VQKVHLSQIANQIALQWHPDKVEASKRSEAEEKFKDIKEAYEVLTDGTMPLYEYDINV